ncbi:PREDICTED: LOW QUALITY PROTEIN: putative F-box protein At4g17780 [Camelina sativa]|uniref:LOW QUALITY PROTEIN: putative F-box protein At4g17780 n=1 Tax=Camelina sativa TaxID=90675 RepID=A0ABM1QHL4_CAMSA|nr:PREDICTED: LOW QUALITY PROTEIN: putative F-box protein At4g17780 [Camelina sativa]
MEEEEKNPSSIYIVTDLLEDIFLQLPLKSILISKSVSRRWKSILESKTFVERRMSLQKNRKFLAAYNCDCSREPRLLQGSRFKGGEQIVYLHYNTTRPSLTCYGLVCILEPYWIDVLNPWTRQLRRHGFGFGTIIGELSAFSPRYWAMGFGKHRVTGNYKVVKMCLLSFGKTSVRDPEVEYSVLDAETGEWRMLSSPPCKVFAVKGSVCVNRSIYWLHNTIGTVWKILALDLHKEEFHNVSVPTMSVMQETNIVNLDDGLAIANTYTKAEWKLEIWCMDTEVKRWTKTYSIHLENRVVSQERQNRWFTPVSVSKQENLVFYDNHNRLFKYYPRKNAIMCLSSDTCVISPFFENLAPLPLKSIIPYPIRAGDPDAPSCLRDRMNAGSYILS